MPTTIQMIEKYCGIKFQSIKYSNIKPKSGRFYNPKLVEKSGIYIIELDKLYPKSSRLLRKPLPPKLNFLTPAHYKKYWKNNERIVYIGSGEIKERISKLYLTIKGLRSYRYGGIWLKVLNKTIISKTIIHLYYSKDYERLEYEILCYFWNNTKATPNLDGMPFANKLIIRK